MGLREIVKKSGSIVNRCFIKNENKILFESNSDYCDNARALYDFMMRNGYDKKYKFVWCVRDVKGFKKKNFKNTKFVSFKNSLGVIPYFFQMATSKHIFYTHYVPPFMNPNIQNVVNLWHGTPLKTIKGHVHSADLFSYVLSPSDFTDGIISESFDAKEYQLLRCGYPRNDLLFYKGGLLKKLGINKKDYDKLVIWMPTFRRPVGGAYQDSHLTTTGLPLIESGELLKSLNQKLLKNKQLMIIKLHPAQDLTGVDLVSLSNIMMLTNAQLDEQDIQTYQLLSQADVLLTDYSSVYFDFLLLNRPIGFIVDDIEEYQAKRGFVVENALDYMPGVKMKTVDELYSFLEYIGQGKDDYLPQRERINEIMNGASDNKNCERLVDKLNIKM